MLPSTMRCPTPDGHTHKQTSKSIAGRENERTRERENERTRERENKRTRERENERTRTRERERTRDRERQTETARQTERERERERERDTHTPNLDRKFSLFKPPIVHTDVSILPIRCTFYHFLSLCSLVFFGTILFRGGKFCLFAYY